MPGAQIDLMQSMLLTHLHHFCLQVFQISFRQVVLVAGEAVTGILHEGLPLHLLLPQAVDDDVGMNIAGVVVAVRVGDDQGLMPGKEVFRKLH